MPSRGKGKQPISSKKRQRPAAQSRRDGDDEVDSGEDSGDEEAAQHARLMAEEDDEAEKEAAEPAAERRVRLAKEMIAAMDAAHSRDGQKEAGPSGDVVAEALEEDALRRAGRWRHRAAASLRGASIAPEDIRRLRGPRLSPTCVAIAPDESFVVCGCKDGALVRWSLPSGKATKLRGGRVDAYHADDDDEAELLAAAAASSSGGDGGVVGASQQALPSPAAPRRRMKPTSSEFAANPTGHLSDVLSVTISPNGQLIASGGRDGRLLLWDVRTDTVVHQFRGHRGPINALACRRDVSIDTSRGDGNGHVELYSASADRTARVWDLEQRGYVETLYGHQEAITALDALTEQLVLSAAEDRTVRLWKVAEETQLLFSNGHTAPVDACALLHAESFVSGGQDGQLTLWSAKRKRPVCTVPNAHGQAPWGGPCWLSALTAPGYSDVAISGSCDGSVRFWEVDEAERTMQPLFDAPVTGFVNGLAIADSGKFVACAVGQEHRLGRWFKIPEARNSLCIIPMPKGLHVKPKLRAVAAYRNGLRKGEQRTPAEQEEDYEEEEEDDEEEDDDVEE